MDYKRVRAVVIDFYGTLTVGTSVAERDAARHAVARALQVEPSRLAAAITSSFDERARGVTGDLAATLRWLAVGCEAEPTDSQIEQARVTRIAVERAFMTPRPESIEVLAALHAAGLKIGLLSDCTHELPQCWPELPYAPLIDAPVFSIETGLRKPDPAMYATVCERLGVDPTNCLYVGDGGSNELTGAQTAGMRAIQMCGPEFDECYTYDAETRWDGEIITDLRELFVVLSVDPGAIPVTGQRV
jgi:putative hydrolase of the HAD superfamily